MRVKVKTHANSIEQHTERTFFCILRYAQINSLPILKETCQKLSVAGTGEEATISQLFIQCDVTRNMIYAKY